MSKDEQKKRGGGFVLVGDLVIDLSDVQVPARRVRCRGISRPYKKKPALVARLSAGTFVARVDLVKEHAFWFETRGAHPSEFEFKLVSSGHVHVALSGGASRRSAKNKPKSPNIAVVWRSQLTAKPARSSPAARPSMTNSL